LSARQAFLSLLLMAASQPGMALDAALRPSQWVLDNWETTEGLPEATGGPAFSACAGLLRYGTQNYNAESQSKAARRPEADPGDGKLARIGSWLRKNF